MALEYYYSSCQSVNLTASQLLERFQAHFEGEEHYCNMLCEWNSVNLQSMIQANPDKSKGTTFNEMAQRLRQIQRSLDYKFQSDSALCNKIVAVCSDVPAGSFAVLQQTITIASFINNIYAAIENSKEAIEAEKLEPLGLAIYFTDQKYYNSCPSNCPSSRQNNSQFGNRKQCCFVCQKEDCWSTKHTDEEQQDTRARYMN